MDAFWRSSRAFSGPQEALSCKNAHQQSLSRQADFLGFLALALSVPGSKIGFHPVLTTALPTFSDASMRGTSFDVRKVRATSLPYGLNEEATKGRDFIIVKQPRTQSEDQGGHGSLAEILVELQVLANERIASHPNIIALLGCLYHNAGDTNDPEILPALILEYAEFGDLQSFQDGGRGHQTQEKFDICRDVAEGLQCLHQNGIVHGDVKAANMLVCRHASRAFIVKISDFGFAIASSSADPIALTGYTAIFAAPEAGAPLERALINRLDIFSYGLLLHGVMKNGQVTFSNIAADQREAQARDLKSSGILPDLLQANLLLELRSEKILALLLCKILAYTLKADPLHRLASMKDVILLLSFADPKDLDLTKHNGEELYRTRPFKRAHFHASRKRVMETFELCLSECEHVQNSSLKNMLVDLYRERFRHEHDMIVSKPMSDDDEYYEWCGGMDLCIFRFGIALSAHLPSQSAVRTMEDIADASKHVEILREPTLDLPRHQNVTQKMPEVVKSYIALTLGELMENSAGNPDLRQRSTYNMASCYIDGIGVQVDISRGLTMLSQAAQSGCRDAQRAMLRFYDNEQTVSPDGLLKSASWKDFPELKSLRGLHKKLKSIAPEVFANMQEKWRLENALQSDNEDFHPASMDSHSVTWQTKIIFFAAWTGMVDLLNHMLSRNPKLVDTRNECGQTPLITACQSGCFDAAMCLLEAQADVTLHDRDGWTALHWIIAFSDEQQAILLDVLIADGADLNAFGIWPASGDKFASNLLGGPEAASGTPLHWAIAADDITAVDLLSSMGANVASRAGDATKTALEMAADLHEPKILSRLLAVDDVKAEPNVYHRLDKNHPVEVNALFWALSGRSRFHRLIQHGTQFEQDAHDTIRLLCGAGLDIGAVLRAGPSVAMTAPFAIAYHQCNADLLKFGLEYGFKNHLNTTFGTATSGGPPMSLAIAQKDFEMYTCLLDAGASMTWRNIYNQDALSLVAKETDDPAFARELLDRGATIIPSAGKSAFWVAVYCGNLKMADYLWKQGAERDSRDESGTTVLGEMTRMRTRAACTRIEYILQLPDRDEGDGFVALEREEPVQVQCSVLHMAVSPLRTDELFVEDPDMEERCRLTLSTLLQKYNSPHQVNSTVGPHYDTPLGLAVEIGNYHAVRILLEAGADANIEDEYGRTPLDKNLFRHCFPASIDVISSVAPDQRDELTRRLNFVNSNTAEIQSLLECYGAKPNVFRLPSWYSADPGPRSVDFVARLLAERQTRTETESSIPVWGGMPIRIPSRPMQWRLRQAGEKGSESRANQPHAEAAVEESDSP